jgi:hypothetical protein
MKRSRIELDIGELILRSLPALPGAQRASVAAAIERELQRLLAERGLPSSLARGGYVPHIGIDNLQVAADATPDAIGAQIAQSMYGSLSGSQTRHRSS